MRGSYCVIIATLAALLLAHGTAAQQNNPAPQGNQPIPPPVITTVTPGNTQAIIGFVPPVSSSNPIREYVVSCTVPGDPAAGAIEVTADVPLADGNQVLIQGLQNGQTYECSMIARSTTGGLLPRAINSAPSNPTPAFTPSANGGPTVFISSPPAPEQAAQTPAGETAVIPPTTPPAPTSELGPNDNLPAAPVVKDVVVGPADVTISFDPVVVAPGGEPITGYTASCQSNSGVTASSEEPATAKPVRVPADVTKIVVEGLAPGEYTCSVAADTAKGTGRATAQVVKVSGSPASEASIDEETDLPQVPPAKTTTPTIPIVVPQDTKPVDQSPRPVASSPPAPKAPVNSAIRTAASTAMVIAAVAALLA